MQHILEIFANKKFVINLLWIIGFHKVISIVWKYFPYKKNFWKIVFLDVEVWTKGGIFSPSLCIKKEKEKYHSWLESPCLLFRLQNQ